MFKSKKRKIKEECWNLNWELVQWLKVRLPIFLEDSSKIIDLDGHTFMYKKHKYTESEIIKKLIEDIDFLLDDLPLTVENALIYPMSKSDEKIVTNHIKQIENTKNEMYDLLKLVHDYLWW